MKLTKFWLIRQLLRVNTKNKYKFLVMKLMHTIGAQIETYLLHNRVCVDLIQTFLEDEKCNKSIISLKTLER